MWRVKFLGEEFSEGELTLGQLGALVTAAGYRSATFAEILGAENAKTFDAAIAPKILAALLQDRLGLEEDDATDKVSALRRADVEVSTYDDLPTGYVDGFPTEAEETYTI